jgi:hypothetical protein
LDITPKFCRNCATLYEDLTFKKVQSETDSCPLCEFYSIEKDRISEGGCLRELVLQKSRNLAARLTTTVSVPTSTDIVSITHELHDQFRMFTNSELFEQFLNFFELVYLKSDKLKYEHSLAEFFYLADQCFNYWDDLRLLDNTSKVKYSIYRFSCFNPPNVIKVDDDLNSYQLAYGNLGETREQHLLKHLTVPESQVINRKSSCKPHIISTTLSAALMEVNELISRLSSQKDVICLRTLDQGYQIRLYYNLQPALVLLISDQELGHRGLSINQKPLLITCYTTNSVQELLKPMYSFSDNDFRLNFVPDFIGG